MDGCDGERLHVNHFWNLKGEPYISDEGSWFVYQCDLHYSKKQTNIIFIFHIFKIMYTFASFSATETSSTNDGIYMSSITQGEHCYFGGQKLLAVVCLSDCIDKENKNSFKRTRFYLEHIQHCRL